MGCLLESKEAMDQKSPMGQKYGGMPNTFQTNLCNAPCKNPGCCLIAFCCPTCAACTMRSRVLEGDLSRYICCQGDIPGCCCFKPGQMGESSCPELCLCCEACCCLGLSVSSTRMVIMDAKQLAPDPCDYRLMCFSNFLQILSCICHIAAIIEPSLRDLADLVDRIADLVFYMILACMVAQVDLELKAGYGGYPGRGGPMPKAQKGGAPATIEMGR